MLMTRCRVLSCPLQDIEGRMLKLLSESDGNLLDDEALINTLNNAKLTSGGCCSCYLQTDI